MEDKPSTPQLVKNKTLRLVLIGCGFFLLFLAFLGAILPVVPTTPFLLASAACFYRSSDRFYKKIMYNKYFGHYLRDYKSGNGIPMRVKVLSILFLWCSSLISVFFFIPYWWLSAFVIAIISVVTFHILRIKTKSTE